jgi:hypothetical protein
MNSNICKLGLDRAYICRRGLDRASHANGEFPSPALRTPSPRGRGEFQRGQARTYKQVSLRDVLMGTRMTRSRFHDPSALIY